MNIKTEAVLSKNDVPRIHVKKEEEEEEEEDRNSNNYDGTDTDTDTDTAGRKSCGFEQVKAKKEEEGEKEDDGNNNNNNPAEINNFSNRKNNDDNNNDDYADWKVGNWCWVLSPSTTTTTNTNANATATAIPSATSSSRNNTSTRIRRKRTAASRSRNTMSVMKKDTSKSKKTRLLPPPIPPPPPSNNRHATTVKRVEEDSVCYNDEVNNKTNDDDDDDDEDDDDDGYESWTEGNWCLILPTGSSSSSSSSKYTKKQNNQWNEMFHRLLSYKNQHNSTSVPKKNAADPELGVWVHTQRGRNEALSEYRVNLLNSIGFVWNPLDNQWDKMFQRLLSYKKQHNSTSVPKNHAADIKLANWVRQQRGRNEALSEYRVNLLNSIGFVWNPLDNQWDEMFQRLLTYKNQHNGSTLVPKECEADAQLGWWVQTQRHRNNPISDHRLNLLNSIGFVWNTLDNQWDEMFQRLVTYKNQHNGSTLVPQRYEADIQLARWVHWQRHSYSNKMISIHRIERLESIDFVWKMQ